MIDFELNIKSQVDGTMSVHIDVVTRTTLWHLVGTKEEIITSAAALSEIVEKEMSVGDGLNYAGTKKLFTEVIKKVSEIE